jgi:hypothetical protein
LVKRSHDFRAYFWEILLEKCSFCAAGILKENPLSLGERVRVRAAFSVVYA